MNDINSLIEKCEEVSSTYASRKSIERTQDWFLFKLQEKWLKYLGRSPHI